MGATLSSPLYPLYELAWDMPHATTTAVHVVYMAGVLVAFLFLGGLTDRFGPVAVVRSGLLAACLGLVACAFARNAIDLGAGRALIGLAAGTISTAATIGLLRLDPAGGRVGSVVASVVTMVGFGSGPLLGGLLAQFAPAPLVTPYVVVAVACAGLAAALLSAVKPASDEDAGYLSFRPNLRAPSIEVRATFVAATLSTFVAYALFTLLAALAPAFLAGLLPWHGPAVSGTAVAAVLACSALVQLPARRLAPRRTIPLATILLAAGALLLAAAMQLCSGALFALADLTIGMGHGLSFMSGLVLIRTTSSDESHTGILSLYLALCYLGAIVPVLLIGRLADKVGLPLTVTAFCLGFASLLPVSLVLILGSGARLFIASALGDRDRSG
ncbi:MFS transporter [Methylobacterium sp. E-005]|nr:MFS transporter [Methylobacterium sp. E-005]